MKTALHLNLSQQLTLTPQLQQAIRLLQLSTLDLNQEILQAVETNPMLELDEHTPTGAPADSHYESFSNYRNTGAANNNNYNDNNYLDNIGEKSTDLRAHLRWQMELTPFSDLDAIIATTIIDAINDDGFLECSIEDIQTSLENSDYGFELDEIEAVLHRIQRFEPAGCGARDLGECLSVQLSQLPSNTPHLTLAQAMVKNNLELLTTRHYPQLLKTFSIDKATLKTVIQLIHQLNPKPGSKIVNHPAEYIVPDIIIKKVKGQWVASLNAAALPKININSAYAAISTKTKNQSDNNYIKNHLQEARWFIKSIQSRQETLMKVAQCILKLQKDFFEQGDEAMKPLVLHDVANAIEMHESTISRVTTQKYMHTPRGIFELKYFFSSHVNTNRGGECSSTAIRAVIKKIIAAENTMKPLSDNKIAQLLADQGIKVARRTVTKYRESMGIPPSYERKSFLSKN